MNDVRHDARHEVGSQPLDDRAQAQAVYDAAVEQAWAVIAKLRSASPLARRVLQLQAATRKVTAAYLAWAALSEE
jgi:hypothetical protein